MITSSVRLLPWSIASIMVVPTIVIHGGAGHIPDAYVISAIEGVKKAAEKGFAVLEKNGSVLDAVQAAVEYLEDDPHFNAGTGGVLTSDGELEADAIVMEGTGLRIGSVGGVKRIRHPVALARKIMEKSGHAMLVGEGAQRFAIREAVETVPAYRLITPSAIENLENLLGEENGKDPSGTARFGAGTVGAVAVDRNGKVAMATSTGGLTGKSPGRIGDTPLPGCGGYADDDVGAVSATGAGESIMRVCLSRRILTSMEQGKSAQAAIQEALNYMRARVGDTAGAIAVSSKGDVGVGFISERMAWACKKEGEAAVGGVHQMSLRSPPPPPPSEGILK